VFYDLKTCLRSIDGPPAPAPKAKATSKKDGGADAAA
jgi:hypothetical protein